MADDDDQFPGAVLTRTGQTPKGFIVHHTAGRGEPKNVVNWWRKQGKGIGSQYIMDRNGVIHDTAKEFGYTGTGQIAKGYGKTGAGLSNDNTIGMEIVAKDDKDVTPQQAEAFAKFIAARYPTVPLYGHGQVNPNERQSSEGMTALNAAMALRGGGTATAFASPESSAAATSPAVAAINQATGGVRLNAANAPIAGALAAKEGPLDTRELVYNKLTGIGLKPHQALGAMYGLGGESGAGFNTGAYNPKDPGGSIGIAQWNGPRRRALEAFAQARGTSLTDPGTQADFLVDELTNKNAATYQPGVLAAMQRTGNVADATNTWVGKFERPKVNNWQERFKRGSGVGTLDANGQFAVGTGAPSNTSGVQVARAGQVGPRDQSAAPGVALPAVAPIDDAPWWQKAYGAIVDKPKDAQGNPTGKPSPFEQLAETMAKGPERMKALEEAQAPQSVQNYAGAAPTARNVSPGLANVAQTYGQTLNSYAQPLTWNNAPPRAPQMAAGGFQPAPGSQAPGMSINSFLPPSQGIGYGIDPIGFGYG